MRDTKKFHNRFCQIADTCARIRYIRERGFQIIGQDSRLFYEQKVAWRSIDKKKLIRT